MADDALDRLVANVQNSAKHGRICAELIRRVGADELAKRRNLKAAIKATKNKLHQIGGAYLDSPVDYARWLESLADAASDPEALRDACRQIMSRHASTRERLPILDDFYAAIFAETGLPLSILDIACGLNPLALPWMPLPDGARYHAIDIYADMVDFLNGFFRVMDVDGHAEARDAQQYLPPERADVALILKTIPCLEQVDKAAGARLLDAFNARWLVVSFPARSLGGYDKGMVDHYAARMAELLDGKPWPARKLEFETELVYIIEKSQ